MASLTKLSSGNWRALVRVKGFQSLSETFPTKTEAKRWADGVEAEIRAGKRTKFENVTLGDVFDRYAESISSKDSNPKRKECQRIAAFKKQWSKLPRYGDVTKMFFHEIDTPHFVAWRDMRLSEISEGGVKREATLVRKIFRVARLEWKLSDRNIFEGVKMPKDNAPRDRRPKWTEIKKVLRALGYATGEVPHTKQQEIAYMFLLALRTGLRPCELHRLHDEDVDLARNVMRSKRKTFYITKRIREVPFTSAAARLFRPLKGWGGALFSVTDRSRDAMFRKALANCGVKGLQFRDSRAEAATRLARSKRYDVDVLTLGRLLDHKNLNQLERTYYRETADDIAKRL